MRGKIISLSATVLMTELMLWAPPADVQEVPNEIQETRQISVEPAVDPLIIEAPESGVIERPAYTDEEAALIKRVMLAEGQSEGVDGMWLIGSVIVNRVNDPGTDWPDTVEGVILQKNAFSSLADGNFDKVPETTAEADEAWQRILDGDVCPKIVAFENIKSNKLDKWFLEAFTFRHHRFYTKKDDQWG